MNHKLYIRSTPIIHVTLFKVQIKHEHLKITIPVPYLLAENGH